MHHVDTSEFNIDLVDCITSRRTTGEIRVRTFPRPSLVRLEPRTDAVLDENVQCVSASLDATAVEPVRTWEEQR